MTGNMTVITIIYCWTLLEVDRPEDAIRIAEKGLLINPENGWLKLWRGSGNIMLGDTIAA